MLLRLGGARLDVLQRTPAEGVRFAAIGTSILASAAVAAVSMAYAVRLAFAASWPAATVGAALWGLVVLRLNYWLVASLPRIKSWKSLILLAVPRVILTVLLATIVSTPLVLQIFSTEIRAEIPVVQHAQLNAFLAQQKTSPLAKQIAADQAEITKLQATIAANGLTDPYDNTIVQGLQEQLNVAKTQQQKDYAHWQCELYGGPGCSGLAGNGSLAQAAYQGYVYDTQRVNELQQQLNAALAQVISSTTANRQETAAQARAALPKAEAKLKADQAQQAEALASFMRANASTGLLTQLRALTLAMSGNTLLTSARYTLFLFFVVFDSLPVMTRLLIQFGPETTYDKILETEDRVAEQVERQREAMLLLEADQVIAEASLRFASEAQRRLRDHPEEIKDGPDNLYQVLLTGEFRPEHSRSAGWFTARRSRKAAPAPADMPDGRLALFNEKRIPHPQRQLRRLEISMEEFLLIDAPDGIPTLNWTSSIGARGFALLVADRLGSAGEENEGAGEMMISLAGIAGEFDARLGVEFAFLASPAFDQRSEFIRFDDDELALALQNLHGNGGAHVKMFGISSAELSLETVISFLARTGTPALAAHARRAGDSPLIKRLGELAGLPAASPARETSAS